MAKTSKTTPVSSQARKNIVAALVNSGKIHSQADVVKELKSKGLKVTQATASRDLQELGAMRGKATNGESHYVLPTNSPASASQALLLSVMASGNTVVIKTPPAAAQFVASSLDSAMSSAQLSGAIGTIAGDDTVLVIASTANGGSALGKKISALFGKAK
jgi:transcriptional regulator of arginine metabolism